ncbi:MAG: hypothetical protein JWM55_70 [Acidimicrobiaceae bacterium]|nr:hypothetical protein [Acidimicrobiaceae bacterium]
MEHCSRAATRSDFYYVAMANWVVISSLATAGGTLVLAGATFASVRSGNRSARIAEESLLAGMRPLLMPSRPEDAPVKVTFVDSHYVVTPGGGATAEVTDSVLFFTMSLRNVGSGIAVLDGWHFETVDEPSHFTRPPVDKFRRLSRDLYVASGDVSFWQCAYRDPADPEFGQLRELVLARQRLVVDLLYGDHLGGQRMISRFLLIPRGDGGWMATVGRHWNVGRPDPREAKPSPA